MNKINYKFLLVAALLVFGSVLFLEWGTAAPRSISLYSSIDDSSSTATLLTNLYHNQVDYNPYDQFVIVRSGQYVTELYYGDDISTEGRYIRYTANNYNSPASISYGSFDGIRIADNGFTYVGNLPGSVSSRIEQQHRFYFVGLVLLALISVVVLFKIVRRVPVSRQRGYVVR